MNGSSPENSVSFQLADGFVQSEGNSDGSAKGKFPKRWRDCNPGMLTQSRNDTLGFPTHRRSIDV